MRPTAIPESFHKGPRAQRGSFLEVRPDNLLVTAFKLCEDGSGDAILRLYEARGEETRAAILCDVLGAAFRADFTPHEIKTFRIGADGRATEVDFLEGIVVSDAYPD